MSGKVAGAGKAGGMVVVERQIDELKAADYNPRKLSEEQRAQIEASLSRFGFVDPVIVNVHPKRRNRIVGGHQRVTVARGLGLETVPCVEGSLTLAQERELNIRLNKNTGEWDLDALKEHFDAVDLSEWGFGDDELSFFDDAPEPPDPPDAGDKYQEQYGVIVICKDQGEQEKVYNSLMEAGYNVKVVAT